MFPDGCRNCWLPSPRDCSQFTYDVAVTLNQPSILSFVCMIAAVAGQLMWSLLPLSSPLLKQQTQNLSCLLAPGTYTLLRRLWIHIGLGPSTVRTSINTVPSIYVHSINHFALLLCWMHRADWSTIVPGGVISVTIQWVRQETLPGTTY